MRSSVGVKSNLRAILLVSLVERLCLVVATGLRRSSSRPDVRRVLLLSMVMLFLRMSTQEPHCLFLASFANAVTNELATEGQADRDVGYSQASRQVGRSSPVGQKNLSNLFNRQRFCSVCAICK